MEKSQPPVGLQALTVQGLPSSHRHGPPPAPPMAMPPAPPMPAPPTARPPAPPVQVPWHSGGGTTIACAVLPASPGAGGAAGLSHAGPNQNPPSINNSKRCARLGFIRLQRRVVVPTLSTRRPCPAGPRPPRPPLPATAEQGDRRQQQQRRSAGRTAGRDRAVAATLAAGGHALAAAP